MFELPRLTIRARTGVYANGQERVRQILEAALDILIEHGYRAVTLREIARRCDIRMGAIGYYYKSRDDLLQDLLNAVMVSYLDSFDAIGKDTTRPAEVRLGQLIDLILDDIQTQKTTRLFPELWALANHDPFVAKLVDRIYVKARLVINELIAELNPGLDDELRETLALFVSASIKGMTVFAGHGKPWAGQMALIQAITRRTMIDAVKTIRRDTLGAGSGMTAGPVAAQSGWTTPTLLEPHEYRAILNREATAPGPPTPAKPPRKQRAKRV